MKVKIIRQPKGIENGIDLSRYRPGQTYDMATTLAEYLVAEGFALVEMRVKRRPQQPTNSDRRKTK